MPLYSGNEKEILSIIQALFLNQDLLSIEITNGVHVISDELLTLSSLSNKNAENINTLENELSKFKTE